MIIVSQKRAKHQTGINVCHHWYKAVAFIV